MVRVDALTPSESGSTLESPPMSRNGTRILPFFCRRNPGVVAAPRRRVVRRPRIEALEDRCLLAVITEFGNGITGSGLTGITNGPNGNLWFTESNSATIGQITP